MKNLLTEKNGIITRSSPPFLPEEVTNIRTRANLYFYFPVTLFSPFLPFFSIAKTDL